jgi:4-aminobutyrate---pyruvate transaminase
MFCATCGTPMAFASTRYPEETHFYAASLEDPTDFRPEAHHTCRGRLPWIHLDGLPRHDGSAPARIERARGPASLAQSGETTMPDDAKNSWEARADASLYGFTDLPTVRDRGTVVLTHGQGPYIFDVHGRRYLDANSGLWNMVAGFDHPGLIAAAQGAIRRFPGYHAFFGRMADHDRDAVGAAGRGLALRPRPGVLHQLRVRGERHLVKMLWFLARAEEQPQRRKILTRWNGYHGVTVVSASMTGKPYNALFGLPLPGFIHLTCPHYWREGQEGESEAEFTARLGRELEEVIAREGADTIAAFVAEPVMGAGGVIPPSEGYFQTIAPSCASTASRSSPTRSSAASAGPATLGLPDLRFMPDAIIASKALTAGYFPMGAVILGPDLADRLQAASVAFEEFPHGFTASGHPVGSPSRSRPST